MITPNTRRENIVMYVMATAVMLFVGWAYVDSLEKVQALYVEHETLM